MSITAILGGFAGKPGQVYHVRFEMNETWELAAQNAVLCALPLTRTIETTG
jgi:hypothetical protein